MKKLFCFMLALFLVVCIGCDTIDNTSSIIAQLNDVVKETETEASSEGTTTERVEEGASSSVVSSEPVPSSQSPSSSSQVEIINEPVKESEIVVVKPEPVVIKGEKPMSYSYITDEQKRIYEILKVAIRDMKDDHIDLQIKYSEEKKAKVTNDINVAFRAVSFDNPEYFWMPAGYALMNNDKKFFVKFKYTDKNGKQYDFPFSKSDRDTMKKQLDQKVNELLSKVKDKDSFETEVYLHDYLCENIVYTLTEKDDMIYTAYGALVNGKAVCEGYSRAMQLLCDKLEIPCGLVYGWSQGIGHMWNLINPGDGWYHLDVTWDDDDENGIISHRYLNTTRYSMTHNDGHIIAEDYKQDTLYEDLDVYNFLNTECSNTALNYFERRGYVINKCDESEKPLINNLASGGAKFFEVKNNSIETMQSVVSFIAGTLSKPVSYYESYDIVTIVLQ